MANPIERCQECVELLGEYLDGTLPADRAAALEQHLSLCMPCITFVRTYKATSAVCREKLLAEIPTELVSSLQQFLAGKIPGFKCQGGAGKSACSKGEGEASGTSATAKEDRATPDAAGKKS